MTGNPRIQDEMLQQLAAVEEHADYTSLKNELLPRCRSWPALTVPFAGAMPLSTLTHRLDALPDADSADLCAKHLERANKLPGLAEWPCQRRLWVRIVACKCVSACKAETTR